MHSHILGVLQDNEARGLGFGLKQHQRTWCLERGVMVMEWTTDPLVRRNAYFNLTKLGAEAPRYLVDFYGQMRDGINAGDESDRLLIRWRLDSRKAEAAASGETLEPDVGTYRGQPILSVGQDDAPVFTASSSRVLLCETPTDIVALRRAHPALARAWRMAMREAWAARSMTVMSSRVRRARAGTCWRSNKILGCCRLGTRRPTSSCPRRAARSSRSATRSRNIARSSSFSMCSISQVVEGPS